MAYWVQDGTSLHNDIVSLLPLDEQHFDELIACGKDGRIWEHYRSDFTNTEIMQAALRQALLLRESGNQYPFAVYHHAGQRLIGSTRLMDIQAEHRTLEIGFTWYLPAYWHSAVNPACKLLLLTHCFETLGAARVTLQTDELNIRSRRAIQKIGAKYEGILRSNLLRDNGTRRSSAYYSILSEEWGDVKPGLVELLKKQCRPEDIADHTQCL